MRRFTDIPAQVLRYSVSDGGVWVTAWVAVALMLVLLIFVIAPLTRRDTEREVGTTQQLIHYVRRHTRAGGVYPDQQPTATTLTGLPASHWAFDTEWRDHEHPLDAPQTGRHAADGEITRVLVPSEWMPPIGARRIADLVGSAA